MTLSAGRGKRKAEEEESALKTASKRQKSSGRAERTFNEAAAGETVPPLHAGSARGLSMPDNRTFCPLQVIVNLSESKCRK